MRTENVAATNAPDHIPGMATESCVPSHASKEGQGKFFRFVFDEKFIRVCRLNFLSSSLP